MGMQRFRDLPMESHGQTFSYLTKMCIADGIRTHLTMVHFHNSTNTDGRAQSKVLALSEKFVSMAFWPLMTTILSISAPLN